MRKRKVKKIGGSLFLPLLSADVRDYGIHEGMEIDIEDILTSEEKCSEESKNG
jgi:hypothetical protein